MNWQIEFLPEADHDMDSLDQSIKKIVFKGIQKVSQNPLPRDQGGYGKPLGSKNGMNLTNLMKIKFKDIGIRVVYKIIIEDTVMKILIVSARSDEKVYKEAVRRRQKYEI